MVKVKFFFLLFVGFISAYFLLPYPKYVMWLGFGFAAYSAIANDSIQTIGTFIASNKDKPWWLCWLFIGSIFVITMTYSWLMYGGPVSIELSNIKDINGKLHNGPVIIQIQLKDKKTKQQLEENNRQIELNCDNGNLVDFESLGINIKNNLYVSNITIYSPADSFEFGKLKSIKVIDSEHTAIIKSQNEDILGTIRINLNIGGDVSHQRLGAKGYDTAPNEFTYLQICAPLFLLILTRLRMPVSTTFLLLSCFATTGSGITSVITKSLSGYLIAFFSAIILWSLLGYIIKNRFKEKPHPIWRVFQWASGGALWSFWLMQDAANIAVFLPRSLNFMEFLIFTSTILLGLGILFKMGGEKIQKVVEEKSDVSDIRAATTINFIYAAILYIFKIQSKVPMSTTWVFIGLLAGREIAMAITAAKNSGKNFDSAFKLMRKDLIAVIIGFIISLILASFANPIIRNNLF